MSLYRLAISIALLVLGVGVLIWIEHQPAPATAEPRGRGVSGGEPFRLGLVPERDIFEQRRRFAAVAEHLSTKINRPVQLVTIRSYGDVLDEFRDRRIDAAVLGSLITVLAVDQAEVKLVARPQRPDGSSTYTGVIFVPESSPIRTIDELAGKSIAMVPTTTGSSLFAVAELSRRGVLNGPMPPNMVLVGTHDDAILEVFEGRADAGAAKNRRLDDFEKTHPRFRRLATSEPVPEGTVVARKDCPDELLALLRRAFLEMHQTPAGRSALEGIGAAKYVPCQMPEYGPIYDMIETLGPAWQKVDSVHSAPGRPTTAKAGG